MKGQINLQVEFVSVIRLQDSKRSGRATEGRLDQNLIFFFCPEGKVKLSMNHVVGVLMF